MLLEVAPEALVMSSHTIYPSHLPQDADIKVENAIVL